MTTLVEREREFACKAVDLTTGRVVEEFAVRGVSVEHAARALLNLARQRGYEAPQLGKTGLVVYPVADGTLCWVLPKEVTR